MWESRANAGGGGNTHQDTFIIDQTSFSCLTFNHKCNRSCIAWKTPSALTGLGEEHWWCQVCCSRVEKNAPSWLMPPQLKQTSPSKAARFDQSLQRPCHQSLSRWQLTREMFPSSNITPHKTQKLEHYLLICDMTAVERACGQHRKCWND